MAPLALCVVFVLASYGAVLLTSAASVPYLPTLVQQPSDDFGMVAVPSMAGRYFPGFDLEALGSVDRVDCIQRCIRRWPACAMILHDVVARDCWFKTLAVQPGINASSAEAYPKLTASMSALVMPCSDGSACRDQSERVVCTAVSEMDGKDKTLLRASHICESPEELHGFSLSGYAIKGISKESYSFISEKDCIKACRYSHIQCTVVQYYFASQTCWLYGEHERSDNVQLDPLSRIYTWRCSINTTVCGDANTKVCHNSPGDLICKDLERGWKFISRDADYLMDGSLWVGNFILDAENCLDSCKKNKECVTALIDPTRNRCFLQKVYPTRNVTKLYQKNRINYAKNGSMTA